MEQFKHYIQQIPYNVYHNSEVYTGNNIILLKPSNYISDVTIFSEDYHIILPAEAPPPIVVDNIKYEICRRRVVVFNPSTTVFCKKNDNKTSRYSTLSIKKQYLKKVAVDMGYDNDIVFNRVEYPCSNNIRQVIRNFQEEIFSYGNGCQMMIDSISIQIIATMLRELQSNINSTLYHISFGDCYVSNAIDFIREYFHSNISIDDMCREIHITPYHFIRLFKEKTGMTPHEYLLIVRIENAKRLIKSDDNTISRIGRKCGFINNTHFSTTFKRLTGISPMEFKKNNNI